MNRPFAGTGALIRFNLRLDRVRILIWTLAIGLGVWASVVALDEAYPTPESLAARGQLMDNPATVIMTGPAFSLDHYTFGAMVANELYLYVLIPAAIMSILLTVRHTRADEESGRLELVRALPVGHFAHSTAAIVTVAIANVLVGGATAGALIASNMAAPDSLAFGLGTALTGMVFASIAMTAAQVTEHARNVTGVASGALAVAFLVRGIGDALETGGSWLSWFSPFAWAQQTKVYVDLRWWPLAVSVAVIVVLFAVSFSLARRRDLGAGLRAPRPGRARATRYLLQPWGLADHLIRGTWIVTTLGIMFFGVAMGTLVSNIGDMLDANPSLRDWVALSGTDLSGEFAGLILQYVLLAPIIVATSSVLRMRQEEGSGRLAQLLVAGRSRSGFLASWLGTVLVYTVISTVLLGISVGAGVAIGTREPDRIDDLQLASLTYLPAILLIASVAVALYGLIPRFASLAWALVTWVVIVLFLGGLLKLPDWAMNISPLTNTPAYPTDGFDALPLFIMGGITAVLVVVGFLGFRSRDLHA
ncbi:ABC transporter permease [Gulosibacter molinativorax]|uniref:Polyketide antibiotic transporter n=1 Tax=Gulosibacter molinativorax TaxID=256821 RepID=A0ABT7CA78_9MICO|nr:hypothetical protein [Gulosibacter molinativorax]MDJ1372062.1 polyketide antibiotic transporter [Gulosibacter molinativorax]QUY63889.1 Possible ABC antibiotics transporter [Gulosibacter molinativorax]